MRRHSDYLMERARQLYPPSTAEGKIQALNYLLPHIRRMPNPISRQHFAVDAAHQLGIDSALVEEELKQAAVTRRDHLAGPATAGATAVSEAEKLLLRSLAAAPGSGDFVLVAEALDAYPERFAGLPTAPLLGALRGRKGEDALGCVEDPAQRSLLVRVLMAEGSAVEPGGVRAALESLRHTALVREQRRVRTAIAEAERRGEAEEMAELIRRKQIVDQELRAF
ncbi:MAG TPA: DNA primase, partial [Acidobacteriaceae bacterium]